MEFLNKIVKVVNEYQNVIELFFIISVCLQIILLVIDIKLTRAAKTAQQSNQSKDKNETTQTYNHYFYICHTHAERLKRSGYKAYIDENFEKLLDAVFEYCNLYSINTGDMGNFVCVCQHIVEVFSLMDELENKEEEWGVIAIDRSFDSVLGGYLSYYRFNGEYQEDQR